MVVFQYCNKCKREEVHYIENSVLECKICNKQTKINKI